MNTEKLNIMKRIHGLDEVYVPFFNGTRRPFLTCDQESFNDQAWVFESKEELEEKFRPYLEKKYSLSTAKIEKKRFLQFYASLFTLGVNEIVITEKGNKETAFAIEEIIKIPEYSDKAEKGKPFYNPQLQLTAIYFLQELRRMIAAKEKCDLSELEEEMSVNLVKSKFIFPIEKQEVQKDQVKSCCMKDKNGNVFQPVFSDILEFQNFNREGKFTGLTIEFKNLAKIVNQAAKGIIINPAGFNLVVFKEQFEGLLKKYGPEEQ